jgi:hypothetical protein
MPNIRNLGLMGCLSSESNLPAVEAEGSKKQKVSDDYSSEEYYDKDSKLAYGSGLRVRDPKPHMNLTLTT